MRTSDIRKDTRRPGQLVSLCKIWDADYPWDVRVEKVCRSLNREYEVHLVSRNTRRRSTYERDESLHIHRLPIVPWLPSKLNSTLGFPVFFNPIWLREIGRTALRYNSRLLLVRDVPLALSALFIGRLLRIPVVLDMAENYPAMIQDVWDSGRARIGDGLVRNPRLTRIVERVAIKHVDHILAVVEESKNRLVEIGVPGSKVTVVMNTPELDRREELGGDALGSPFARHRDQLTLVYLGLLEVPRGLGTAIRAMREVRRRLPRVRLVVIGSGRDEELFKQQARAAGVADSVEFRGWVEYGQALRYIATCDVGLVPHHATASWNTTIPNKLFDYMSLRKPVIVSNAKPTERIVAEEQCGLVFSDRDASALAEAIVALADPLLREECGRRGREAVCRRYNWKTDERSLLRALQPLIRDTRDSTRSPGHQSTLESSERLSSESPAWRQTSS